MPRAHRRTALATLVALLLPLLVASGPAAATVAGQEAVDLPDAVLSAFDDEPRVRVMVELRADGVAPQEPGAPLGTAERAELAALQDAVLARLGSREARVLQRYEYVPYLALEITETAAHALRSLPGVHRVTLDEVWTPTLNESVPLVGAPQVWHTTTDGTGSAVAVLDTGVDGSHPALAGRVRAEACFSTPRAGGHSACPRGATEEVGPGSGVACTGSAACSHGTHVAAIAAGGPDPVTGPGVAPGADIVAVQVSHYDAEGQLSINGADVLKALEWVYANRYLHDVRVVNLSMGEGRYSRACDDHPVRSTVLLLRSAGIVIVAATGNDYFVDGIAAPACISEVVAVGASSRDDTVAPYSNAHPTLVDLHAPGTGILAAIPGGYGTMSGTSMAAPHVAGALALMATTPDPGTIDARVRKLRDAATIIDDERVWPSVAHRRLAIDAAIAPSLDSVEACTHAPFKDVGVNHRFCVAIASGAEAGIIKGWPDETFRPREVVSRQAAVSFLYARAGRPPVMIPTRFDDVPEGHRFYHAIHWASQEGIVNGYGDDTFRPTDPVTRQAAMAFLHRVEGAPAANVDPERFVDVDADHRFATEIAWGANRGITRGYDDNTFRPLDPVTRQAMAVFLAELGPAA